MFLGATKNLLTGVVLVSTFEHTRLVWVLVIFYILFCIIGSTGISYSFKNSHGTSLVLVLDSRLIFGWYATGIKYKLGYWD
jgi:hypothetical protein